MLRAGLGDQGSQAPGARGKERATRDTCLGRKMKTIRDFHFKAFLFPRVSLRFRLKSKTTPSRDSGSSVPTQIWTFQIYACHPHQGDTGPGQGDSDPLGPHARPCTLRSHLGARQNRTDYSHTAPGSVCPGHQPFINPDAHCLSDPFKTPILSCWVGFVPERVQDTEPRGQRTTPLTDHRTQGKSLSCWEMRSSQG